MWINLLSGQNMLATIVVGQFMVIFYQYRENKQVRDAYLHAVAQFAKEAREAQVEGVSELALFREVIAPLVDLTKTNIRVIGDNTETVKRLEDRVWRSDK